MSADPVGGDKAVGRRTSRWLRIVLILSLAINLLIAGVVAGRWWMHGRPHGPGQHPFTAAIERLMKDLPEAKREHAGELLKHHRDTVRPLRELSREAREGAREAILTDPYDEAKVKTAFDRFRDIRQTRRQSTRDMMLGLMRELNLEERKKLLNYIRAGFRKRWRGRRPGNDGRPPKP